ncbi:hypothetical protein JCM19045_2978 [Bacillus sp. JCM 19045]|nr:hypothetical protein JCM19045_2978 [Bacillus sp. JCM 19045]
MFGDDRDNPDGNVEDPNVEEPSETGGGTEEDLYVSVNEYTGEGYSIGRNKEAENIGEKYFDEIEKGVKEFFEQEYKVVVNVNNLVGNELGVIAIVQAIDGPSFQTQVIIPINNDGQPSLSEIQAPDFSIEEALYGGLVAMTLEEEFNALNDFVEETAENMASRVNR